MSGSLRAGYGKASRCLAWGCTVSYGSFQLIWQFKFIKINSIFHLHWHFKCLIAICLPHWTAQIQNFYSYHCRRFYGTELACRYIRCGEADSWVSRAHINLAHSLPCGKAHTEKEKKEYYVPTVTLVFSNVSQGFQATYCEGDEGLGSRTSQR